MLAPLLFGLAALLAPTTATTFSFAASHGSGMVLQRAPHHSVIKGYCTDGDRKVTVEFKGQKHEAMCTYEGTFKVGTRGLGFNM